MSDTTNPVRALLGPCAQQAGVFEHADLLVTSAAANQRNDVRIRRTDGVHEFHTDGVLAGIVAITLSVFCHFRFPDGTFSMSFRAVAAFMLDAVEQHSHLREVVGLG
ncbi:MAG TPA: hypothetical protein VH369_06810 [Bryobacteraceae bacterium]|jgi:hypothetical protein